MTNYVKQYNHIVDQNATDSVGDFLRFPRWMWRNDVVVEFIEWLKKHNSKLESNLRIGFYGLDLYSLHESRDSRLYSHFYFQTSLSL